MSLTTLKQNWEDMAELDPLWGILGDSQSRYGKWDVNAFFKTGQEEIGALMEIAGQLGAPKDRETVLDFGCGVGRLTRAAAAFFHRCVGLDISAGMIQKAIELNHEYGNCSFQVNDQPDLATFPDSQFDMIYSFIVLQHVPHKDNIKQYIAEFVRVLKPGGLLAFQLPTHLSLRSRLQPRRRMYAILRSLGVDKGVLYKMLALFPNQLNSIPEKEIIDFLKTSGARTLRVVKDARAGPGIPSNTYYCTK
jgi:ubiquinone/menaquinone biosynthesis C-methylase UbiE